MSLPVTDDGTGRTPRIARNSIAERQRSGAMVTVFSAARVHFDFAMRVATAEVFLSVAIPIGFTAAALMQPELANAAAIYGLVLALAEPAFDRARRHAQELGALHQELFDCGVLSIPHHESLTGPVPDPEDTRDAARKVSEETKARADGWYTPVVAALPLPVARIACQRTNCRWDAVVRERYMSLLWVFVGMLLVGILAWNMLVERTTTQFVLSLAAVAPAVRWVIAELIRQSESAKVARSLKERAEKLWDSAARGADEGELARESRDLQDGIFLRRKGDPATFRWVHEWLRPRLEEHMHDTAEEMVEQYEARRGQDGQTPLA